VSRLGTNGWWRTERIIDVTQRGDAQWPCCFVQCLGVSRVGVSAAGGANKKQELHKSRGMYTVNKRANLPMTRYLAAEQYPQGTPKNYGSPNSHCIWACLAGRRGRRHLLDSPRQKITCWSFQICVLLQLSQPFPALAANQRPANAQ
jgi:hypothetical protein